jgi:two-component system cell cycle sensor histidine kinase/response regulator CckA
MHMTRPRPPTAVLPTSDGISHTSELLKQALSLAKAGSWILNLTTSELIWSDEIYELLDLTPHSCRPTLDVWSSFLHPDDRFQILNSLRVACEQYLDTELTYRVITSSKTTRWVESRSQLIYDLAGRATHRIGISMDITSRKLAEQEHARLAAIVEHSHDAIIGKTLEGIVTSWNRGASALYNYTTEEAIGQHISFIVPPDFRDEHSENLARTERGEHVARSESTRVRKDGTLIYVSIVLSPIRDHADNLIGISTIARDMTAWRHTQELVNAQRAFLRQVIDLNPSFVFAKNREGRFTLVNKALADAYGTTPEELTGKCDSDFSAATAQVDKFRRDDLQVFETGLDLFIQEEPINDSSGATRWLQTIKRPIFDADNNVIQVLGISTDITLHKQAKELLKQSETKYRQLISQASDGIVLFTTNGRIIEANTKICELVGMACEELIVRHVDDFFIEEELADSPLKLQQLREGETVLTERWLLAHDGSRIPIEISARMLPDNNVIIAIVRDIRERKAAEAQMQESARLLALAQRIESTGTLAGGIAHDFNNRLTIILGNSDICLRRIDRPGTAEDKLAFIKDKIGELREEAVKSGSLISQLQSYSRQQPLERRVVNLNESLTRLMRILKPSIGEGIELRFIAGADLPAVLADVRQIEDALINLVNNARDALPADSGVRAKRIIIETSAVDLDSKYRLNHEYSGSGAHVLITVSDNGTGITAETRQRMFEPFYTTKPEGKGTGLGLAMVFGTIKQHNGTIEVYTEPGHGTTIKLYLPAASDAAEHTPSVIANTPHGHETILIAEDELSLRRLLCEELRELGYKVIETSNGAEAVEVYRSRHAEIDLLMLDVIMPELNGPEALAKIRQLNPAVRSLFITGWGEEMARTGLDHQTNLHMLQKPYDIKKVAQKVREVLSETP